MRDKSPELGYDMCCLWAHFSDQFEEKLGSAKFMDAETSFTKGQFDREFTEKVKAMDPSITVEDFRFVALLQGTQTTVRSVQCLEQEAEMELESSRLKAISIRIQKEQLMWTNYKASLQEFQSKNAATMQQHLLEQKQAFKQAADEFITGWLPVHCISDEMNVGAVIQNGMGAFSQKHGLKDLYQVMVIDFTKLGSAFSKYLASCTAIVSEFIGASPKTATAVILAPNTSTWGATYSESGINTAVNTVEEKLRDDSVGLLMRRGSLSLSESSLATHSFRPGFHDFFMMISDLKTPEGSLVSDFGRSSLWIRRTVTDVAVKPVADYVVPDPSQMSASNTMNSFSKAQRQKQSLSGHTIYDKILQKALVACQHIVIVLHVLLCSLCFNGFNCFPPIL